MAVGHLDLHINDSGFVGVTYCDMLAFDTFDKKTDFDFANLNKFVNNYEADGEELMAFNNAF